MRKALLFVKVVLLLATFVGTSSSHASKSGGHNLLALSAFDANISFGQQNTTEEDKSVVTDLELPLVVFQSSPVTHWQLLVLGNRIDNSHFARAPPVNALA
jgi:hypothetical protein